MFAAIDPGKASGATKDLLEVTQRQLGKVPNLYRTMANSPTALAGYLAFRDALQKGELSIAMRERVALLTAQLNACDYCIAAHAFRSQKIGLDGQDIQNTRLARSSDPVIHAALKFIAELIRNHGQVSDDTITELSEHGWSEALIGEMVAHVALNTLSNYFKHVAHPDLDFPAAPSLGGATTSVEYAVDSQSAVGQWSIESRLDFVTTLERLKVSIAAHDLLLISEIDPQHILMSAGMKLRPARQLLFFHPRYMKRLLEADNRAVTEVPLKIVVLEAKDGSVVLRGPDVVHSFARFDKVAELSRELANVVSEVLGSVSK
jgi:uncharacterized peroxidase-related enzyme